MAIVPASDRRTSIVLALTSAGPFSVGFRLFEDSAIEVRVNGVVTTAYSISSDYSGGYDDNAQITLNTPAAAGSTVEILGNMTVRREDDLSATGFNLVEHLDSELARQTVMMQDLRRFSVDLFSEAIEIGEASSLCFPSRTLATMQAVGALADGQVAVVAGLAYQKDSTAVGSNSCANDLSVDGIVPAPGTQATVLHWGVDLSGATDDGARLRGARAWCIANDRSLHCPEGVYNDAGTTYTRAWPFLWYPGDTDSGSVAYWTLVQRTFLHQQTLGVGSSRLVGHHYMVEADDPNNVEPVKVNLTATAGSGHTGVYINTTGSASAQWMAGYHAETRAEGSSAHINFNSETRCYDPTQAVYGHVIKMSSGSTVAETDPSLNVNHPTTGNPPVYNPNAVGIYIHGNADTDADKGGWPKAILVSNAAIDEDGVVMEVNAPAGANLLHNTAMVCSDSVIRDDASNNRFIDLRGTVNIGFRMVNAPGISAVQIDAATGRALYYPNATDGPAGLRQNAGRWEFESGGTSRLRIDNVTGDIDQLAGAAVASHSLRSELSTGLVGQTRYIAKDSGGNDTEYAEIEARALDNTDGAEYGRLSLRTSINGAITTVISLGENGSLLNPVSMFLDGGLHQVTPGAADSAGPGFRNLRIPN